MDDLRDFWRAITPNASERTVKSITEEFVPFVSIRTEQLVSLQATMAEFAGFRTLTLEPLHEDPLPFAHLFCMMQPLDEEDELEVESPDLLLNLLRLSRDAGKKACRKWAGRSAISSLLEKFCDLDIGPRGEVDEDAVLAGFRAWVLDDPYDPLMDPDLKAVFLQVRPPPKCLRALHLCLLGGPSVFNAGMPDRMVAYALGLEQLTEGGPHIGMISSAERQARANGLDTLLEELVRWQPLANLTVVLGWSGQSEHQQLLQGLCPALLEKIRTSALQI